MLLGDVQHDRSGLEQGQTVLFISRNLPERLKRLMRGLLHRGGCAGVGRSDDGEVPGSTGAMA